MYSLYTEKSVENFVESVKNPVKNNRFSTMSLGKIEIGTTKR